MTDSLQKIQQLPEGKRRFLMLLSMVVLSFLMLAIAWKSFERNLGIRLGDTTRETEEAVPGPLQSLVEDIKRIAGGEKPLTQKAERINNDSGNGTVEKIFSIARETRRVLHYNASEIQKLFEGAQRWLVEILW